MTDFPKFKGAFKCHKCPQNADVTKGRACPMWWEIIETNTMSGATRVNKGCGCRMLPHLMTEVMKSANMSTANTSETKNKVIAANAALADIRQSIKVASRTRGLGEEYKREIELYSGSTEPDGEARGERPSDDSAE